MIQTTQPQRGKSASRKSESGTKARRRFARRRAKAIHRSVDDRASRFGAEADSSSPRRSPKPKKGPKQPSRHRQMREQSTQKIYDIQSKVYDATFGRLVKKRIHKAIDEHVRLQEGQVVLDVGIGTGASFNFYPKNRGRIFGVDLSGGMLEKAYDKIEDTGRSNAQLARANALELPFADDSFDTVFVSHVISVVSDPVKLLIECCRVAKPGAKIVMVNHFQSTNKAVAAVEKLLCPLCTKLGWRSDLALEELTQKTGLQIDYRYKLSTPDLWETVVITNTKINRQLPSGVAA